MDDKCFEYHGHINRPVTPEEVEEVYHVEPYGIYKGYKVGFMGDRIDEETKEIRPTCIDGTDADEVIKALNIPRVDREEYWKKVPIKDIDFYEREEYYDKYEFFQDIHNPYKTVDYHVVIENGELHRYKIDK